MPELRATLCYLNRLQRRRAILQKVLIKVFLKLILVLVADGDIYLAKHNAETFDGLNPAEVNDE